MKFIDNFLNTITMYRLVLYCLTGLALVTILFGALGILYYNPVSQLISLTILIATCYYSNKLFAKMVQAPSNWVDSPYITAFILFFIFIPPSDVKDYVTLCIAGLVAMASKYVLAIRKKHIFNPAAFAACFMGLIGNGNAIWWVGSDVLLPIVAILGFLIVRKIRRFRMVLTFLTVALLSISFVGVVFNKVTLLNALTEAFTSWPLVFFATVMFTEPWTSPPRDTLRLIYAVLVGLLFGSQFQFGPFFSTPELSLLIGNIYAFIVSPKQRLLLTLKEKRTIAADMFEYVFTPNRKLAFLPGQYLEWTLPHKKPDARGFRRYFTIASAPTEPEIKLGIKYDPQHASTFKKNLSELDPKQVMAASQLAGDFTMPADLSKKLVFIAGGIGVTPFRSMIQYMMDAREKRDIVFLYTVPDPKELAYRDIFEKAGRELGMHYYYVVTRPENAPKDWTGKTGRITGEMVQDVVPDFKDRMFYLSGPNAMVETYQSLLLSIGVHRKSIKTDYFPGF
jgi:ferredoxin-NADP reductase/Na+-translocating ferredoxin:NAD+ oxidoreductase RnfD subunit